MQNENKIIDTITLYMASWMWHVITIILMCTGIICLVLQKYPFAFGIFGAMLFSEFMSWKRIAKLRETLEG